MKSYGCRYTRTIGIWRTVWLEPVSATHIHSFRFYPDPDNGLLHLRISIENPQNNSLLHLTAYASRKKVGEEKLEVRKGVILASLKLSEVHLWEPANPFLYDLEISLKKNGEKIDSIKSYFGLRKIQIEGKKVLINNKSIFQRLVLDQGYYPEGIYTAPDDESLKNDIEISLGSGFNGARLHQKVFEPRFLYWTDRLGHLVWGEYPNGA